MATTNLAANRLSAITDQLKQTKYDIAVVGLGALGSAATWQAARKGVKVIAFEQFEFGHVRGSSHDTNRIVRTSYEIPEYVALAKAAYRDWADLEAAAKVKLLTITGGVVILPKDGNPNARDWAKGLEATDVPHEILSAKEANTRWPQFSIKESEEVLYTPDSGMVHAAKSVAAMQAQARFHGAELLENTRVDSVVPTESGVRIQTNRGEFNAAKIVLATDAWVNKLLNPLGLNVPLKITQEQVTYFKPTTPSNYNPDRFPVWIVTGDQWYYGFPTFGEPSIKCAHDNTRIFTSADDRTFVPSEEKVKELTAKMQDMIPDPGRQVLRTVTCQYAMTPDRLFIIGQLEEHKNIILTLGAGHAFKFCVAIGRVAAELAVDGETKEDISAFGFPTPESMANPLRNKLSG